jgi:hypothetical protein
VIGCFANTIAIRVTVRPEASFGDLLAAVRDAQLSAIAHGDLPADRIIRIARPSPTGQVASTNFTFQNDVEPVHRMGPAGPAIELLDVEPAAPAFPLSLSVMEYGDELWARLKYAPDLFCLERVTAWLEDYCALLHQIVELSEPDRDARLIDLTDTPATPEFTF